MALADSGRAIGAVTRLLQLRLLNLSDVSVGKPEEAGSNNTSSKLNLFLYEATFDGHLRNHALRNGEQPPLWMVLKYLLTAFDASQNSDTIAAHELLGQGISALNDLNFLTLDSLLPVERSPLENNPEPLKLTFDETTADLLSKIMQGTDERYRLSVAFQIRPVMIMPGVEPHASLLVGVDYSAEPVTIRGDGGVAIDVRPSLGPRLHCVKPVAFEAKERVEVHGDDLGGNDIEAVLGNVVLTITERRPDLLVVTAEGLGEPIAAGTTISAGEHPLVVRRRLSATRTRSSNLLAARLRPTVATASIASGNLVLTGLLLGTDADDVVVAFYQDGRTVRLFDVVTPTPDQQMLTVPGVGALPAGSYRPILRVNNQQARASPTVTLP
jgi:Pvc16 N-terminal domain